MGEKGDESGGRHRTWSLKLGRLTRKGLLGECLHSDCAEEEEQLRCIGEKSEKGRTLTNYKNYKTYSNLVSFLGSNSLGLLAYFREKK